ncbi:hypothetical protein GCM10022286_00490 [Gryllotalpicola daejeonensis]|uniref:Uncharacterized protein n=1 Tax=Gryllotalpicola daejeonensis TaxID=993087 RepID=A0ABP7ZCV0_9MICO
MSPLAPQPVAQSYQLAARRQRAAALLRVTAGEITVPDLIREACSEAGRPLLRLTLRQVLLAQPKWTKGRVERTLIRLGQVLEADLGEHARLNLAWLVDPRSGGRRFTAFCDCLVPSQAPPWDGFPWTPRPKPARREGAAA